MNATTTAFIINRKHAAIYYHSRNQICCTQKTNKASFTVGDSAYYYIYHYERHYTLIRVRFRVRKQENGIYFNLAREISPAGLPLHLQLITAG